ncbi:FT-interacting protein 1-like [Ananas comosus]|uniref:FT-interacting protein 1-like n=1 Tax=Ananas comosus TaxID=4615 RepID=A0A6P5GHC6_ANACO|nr:FT-interacting protein 1-like [Ananas comosus]
MAHYCSDFQPSARPLRKDPIGALELGIRSGKDLVPVRSLNGAAPTTGYYCVAKYGPKWARTRTLVNTLNPMWQEQYTWEVFDPCTVLTVAVYHNNQLDAHDSGGGLRDQPLGKLRIRLSTLDAGRAYFYHHPLQLVHPSGIKRTGELRLAVRFRCTAWVNMMRLYARPMLPKQHYAEPIPVLLLSRLRHHATAICAGSFRKSLANWRRAEALLSGAAAWAAWAGYVRDWRNPVTTLLAHANLVLLVRHPDLIIPVGFIYLFGRGVWNYRHRAKLQAEQVQSVEAGVGADEVDEEFDEIPTRRAVEVVRMRYDRLRLRAGRVQTMLGDVAGQAERAHALLSWRDPRATGVFLLFLGLATAVVYNVPFWLLLLGFGLYYMRHPVLRSRVPPAPVNFYKRLPSKVDMLL